MVNTTVESSTLNTKVGLLLQLFMLLSPYALDRDLPWSLLPTCRCPSVTPGARTQGLSWCGRTQPRVWGLASSVPFPGEQQGHGRHPAGWWEAARCLSGSWLQTERHQGPLCPASERGCPAPAESFLWKAWAKPKREGASTCKAPAFCQAVTLIRSLLSSSWFCCSWQRLQRLLLKKENVTPCLQVLRAGVTAQADLNSLKFWFHS